MSMYRATARARRRALIGGSAALLLPAPALVAACGGASAGALSPATAQERLVALADDLDACYAKRGDARKCAGADALASADDLALGDDTGEIDVSVTRPTRYQLTLKVDDRTSFAILAQPVGARKRVCSPAGTGGCPKGGVW